MVYILINKR